MPSRVKDMENKVFKDRDGELLDGCIFKDYPNDSGKTAFPGEETVVYYFKDGLIHNRPDEAAVIFEDGLEEIWDHGKFVGIKEKPFRFR